MLPKENAEYRFDEALQSYFFFYKMKTSCERETWEIHIPEKLVLPATRECSALSAHCISII
jgi:hypothetical protein